MNELNWKMAQQPMPRAHPLPRVAAVIPAYRAGASVWAVVSAIGPEVERIYVIDDACPDGSGDIVEAKLAGERVVVLRNPRNLGVGGAVKCGYGAAYADGMDIIVKLDADGQMDAAAIPNLIAPLIDGEADYAKGNRLAHRRRTGAVQAPNSGRPMPTTRRLGNNLASFLHKAITGYWNILDPANGFTAIHRAALGAVDLPAVADCYFFETDMLFQLNLAEAVVTDVQLPARYADEVSSLRIRDVIWRYPLLALRRCIARVWIKYFLDDFNVASLEIIAGLPLLAVGSALGFYAWMEALQSGTPATAGTVMFAALPIIIGFQLLLSAIGYDVARVPTVPLSARTKR
ncbi:MAG TPA: glycosyltransferase family 2 protein [Allosphingosinicella sp.]